MGTLFAECIDSLDRLATVEDEVRAFLDTEVDAPYVLHDPRVVAAFVAKEQGRSSVFFILVRDGARLVGVAPFFLFEGRLSLSISVVRLARVKVRLLKCFGDRLAVARGVAADAVLDAAFAKLQALRARFDLILFEELISPQPLADALEQRDNVNGFRVVGAHQREEKAYYHELFPSFEAYERSIGSKHRNDMKRSTRAYRGRDGELVGQLDRIDTVAQVGPFLDQVDRIYRKTWQCRVNGYSPRNSEAEANYYRRHAELGWLRCYLLRSVDGVPVAFVTGFQARGTLLLDDIGYDLDARETAPGISMLYFMLKDLYRADGKPALLDLGFGENRYKKALATGERRARAVYLVARRRYRVWLAAQHALDAVYESLHRRVKQTSWEPRLRGWIKRGLRFRGAGADATGREG